MIDGLLDDIWLPMGGTVARLVAVNNYSKITYALPNSATDVAIDSYGNVWVANRGYISKFAPPNYSRTDYNFPTIFTSIAVDKFGNVFAIDALNYTVYKLSKSNNYSATTFSIAGYGTTGGITTDQDGNVWISANGLSNEGIVIRLLASNNYSVSSFVVGGSSGGIAIDSKKNVWIANGNNIVNTITRLLASNNYSKSTFVVGDRPVCIAIDQDDSVWTANLAYNTSSGTATRLLASNNYSKTEYSMGGDTRPSGIGIDNKKNVWVLNSATGTISRLLASNNYARTNYSVGASGVKGDITGVQLIIRGGGSLPTQRPQAIGGF